MMVIGIPRSRTAWFSEFLSYGDKQFLHEGMDGCSSIDEYANKTRNCGDCGTGLMLIQHLFPERKKVIIHKSKKGVERSIEWVNDNFKCDLSNEINKCNDMLKGIIGLHVEYDNINDECERVWEFLRNDKMPRNRDAEYAKKIIVKNEIDYCVDQALINDMQYKSRLGEILTAK